MSDEGRQSVDDKGQVWTLAEYTVSMWVPVDNLAAAREFLAGKMQETFPTVMQDAPERYGEQNLR